MTAMCLGDLGWRFPIVHARVYLDEALAIWRELGDWRAALPLDGLGRLAHAEGDPRAAQALLEETVGLARKVDFRIAAGTALAALGAVAYAQGAVTARRNCSQKR